MAKIESNPQIEKFISVVRQYPILYDESVEGYLDKDKKELIWQDVAKKIGSNCRICKRKWYSLTLKFHKRETEGEAAITDENGKVWPWYEHMKFIKKIQIEELKPEVKLERPEISNVVTKEKIDISTEPKIVELSNSTRSNSPVNVNGNKLFLESLVEDLSLLSLKDQYEFKGKVLELMQFYVVKNN